MQGKPVVVSVIIRTKDRLAFLNNAIQSVIAQTYRPIELVVVNDGGQDDLLSLIQDWLSSTTDISLQYHYSACKGRAAAANTGLFSASGGLSIFLDDDDYFDDQHIETLVAAYDNVTQDDFPLAVHCQARAVTIDDQNQEQCLSIQGRPLAKGQLFYQNILPILTVLFPTHVRELGVRFDEHFDLFEDWDFWLQINQVCHFKFVDQVSCAYRIHVDHSGVRDSQKQQQGIQQVYEKWLPRLDVMAMTPLLVNTHQWHAEYIDQLQRINHEELGRIGALHEHALNTIASKDRDIEHLSTIYQGLEQEHRELYRQYTLQGSEKQDLLAQVSELQSTLAQERKKHHIMRCTSPYTLLLLCYRCGRRMYRKVFTLNN